MTRWVYANGTKATKRCVNSNRFFTDHLLSDDGTRCLKCGAYRGLNPTEAQRAYDEAVPVPISSERIKEIVERDTRETRGNDEMSRLW
jgi:hypothetical protein